MRAHLSYARIERNSRREVQLSKKDALWRMIRRVLHTERTIFRERRNMLAVTRAGVFPWTDRSVERGRKGDARRKRKSRWGLASRKQDFRIQGHATHAFTYFWTSPLPRAARKYRRGSRTRAPLFFFFFRSTLDGVSPNSPPHIEWKYKLYQYFLFFSFSFISLPIRFSLCF